MQKREAAAARGEVPIGAVVALGDTVIAQAGNRTRELNDPTAHAEMLAIRDAAAALSAERLGSADLYVTLEPCTMCAAAISFARIRRLYFGAADEKGGAVVSGVRFFAVADLPPCSGNLPGHRRNAVRRTAAQLLPGAARLTEQSTAGSERVEVAPG